MINIGAANIIIKQNNIHGNKIDAKFTCGRFNRWQNNYWGGSIFPKIIEGRKFIIPPLNIIPWFEFDWFPAQEPYDIQIE